MGFVLGLLFDGAVIGLIIAFMERGNFPGWGAAIGCAFAIGLTANGLALFLPGNLVLLALLAGAAVGAFAVSKLCDMSLRRGAIAASIYLGVRIVMWLGMVLLMSA